MTFDHALWFATLVCSGFGLLFGAAGLLATRRLAGPWRVVAVLVPCGAAVAAVAAYSEDLRWTGLVAAALAAVAVAGLVVASRRAAELLARVVATVGQPGLVAGAFGAAGLAAVIGGTAWYEREDRRQIDGHMTALGLTLDLVKMSDESAMTARTDGGSAVVLKKPAAPRSPAEIRAAEQSVFTTSDLQSSVLRVGPGGDGTNCHGWVFTAGRHWLSGADVDRILRENQYAKVKEPKPGDVVIYRDNVGEPSHTGVVRYVTDDQPVLVESKWAWMGVFLHPVEASVYGTDFAYYRSPRTGHVLAGLGAPESPKAAPSAP